MELLEGETMAQRILRKPFNAEEAIRTGVEIADALDKAHRFGIVHRDLKPANVMLTKAGAKLMDFGLAKRQAFAASQSGAPAFSAAVTMMASESPITVAGSVVGTVQYMSPEQIQGKDADARSDIFAFGAMLYEMLTGKRAFEGKSQLSMASAILEREPEPISAIQPLTPAALEHTIRTCLAKDPEDRFQSAHDLKLQLLWIAGTSASSLPALRAKSGRGWHKNWPVYAAAALALFSGVLLWMAMRASSAKPAIVRFAIPTPANTQIDLNALIPIAISPDGQRLAYVAKGTDGPSRLYLRRMDEFDGSPIPGTDSASSPYFSPDGQWVGFFTADRIKKVSVDGGAITEVANVMPGAQGASWGADGYIYYNRNWTEGLSRVPQDGGKAETFTSPDPKRHEQSHRWPEVLPDGKNLLLSIVKSFGAQNGDIAVSSLQTRSWKTILPNASNAHYLTTGHLVYVHAGTLMVVPFDLKSLTVTGTPVQMMRDVLSNQDDGFAALQVSNSGNLFFVKGSEYTQPPAHLVWVSRDGKDVPASKIVRAFEDMSLSPDKKIVAFTITGDPAWNIWTLDLEHDTLNRLTFTGDNRDPLWAPDGNHVAYTSSRDALFGIYWSTADGSAPEQRLVHTQFQPFACAFTRDGKKLIFNQFRADADASAWEVPVTGDTPAKPLTGITQAGGYADLSLDGEWIAYESQETGQSEVYVQPYPGPGGKWQISNNGGTRPRWSRDGKELFYRRGDSIMAASVETHPHFSSMTPHAVFTGHYLISGRDYETDGKRFLAMKALAPQQGPTSMQVVLNWASELKK